MISTIPTRRHATRWVVAALGVAVLGSTRTAAATTEPPADTTTDSAATTAAGGGAGPSDCPVVGEEAVGSEAPEGTGATEESAAGTAAADTTTAETAAETSAAPATGPFAQIEETDTFGPILVDGECFTLYAFTQDTEGTPTCADECAVEWPPLFTPDENVPPLADELDASLFTVVEHPDGSQLVVNDHPLYYFEGDTEPGVINGQAMDDEWFVVDADGNPIMETEGTAGGGSAVEASEPAGTEAAATDAPAATGDY